MAPRKAEESRGALRGFFFVWLFDSEAIQKRVLTQNFFPDQSLVPKGLVIVAEEMFRNETSQGCQRYIFPLSSGGKRPAMVAKGMFCLAEETSNGCQRDVLS